MRKRVTTVFVIAIILIGAGAMRMSVPMAFAQDPTIPTRTPTPDPNGPPPDNLPAPTASGNEGSPSATNTPEPVQDVNPPPPGGQATKTPDMSIPSGATAVPHSGGSNVIRQGQEIEGIDPCEEAPYIQTLRRITVHAGPSLNYPVVSTLERGELRLITGRAEFTTWWQIQLRLNLSGWVLDEEVNVFGNTALVPIIDPPLLNGIAPTRGVPWEPTPVAFVPCLPTATPTPTNDDLAAAVTAENVENEIVTREANMTETAVAGAIVEDDEATPLPGFIDSSLAGGVGVADRGVTDSRGETGSDNSLNLILPLIGIGLIGAGILLALLARNRPTTPSVDTQPKES
ncbi:MAG: SH3 domain-containing protein [Chloroflexota bacterium]|jgi:hypothetical protein